MTPSHSSDTSVGTRWRVYNPAVGDRDLDVILLAGSGPVPYHSVLVMPVSEHEAKTDELQRAINDLTERLMDIEAGCSSTVSTVRALRADLEESR